jgi:hypothetical protein
MGLSSESPNPNTATIDAYEAALIERQARNLADRLVTYEHNPDPREAPSPALGVHIRRIDLEKSLRLSRTPVTQECKEHNAMVSGVGHPEQFKHLWGEE